MQARKNSSTCASDPSSGDPPKTVFCLEFEHPDRPGVVLRGQANMVNADNFQGFEYCKRTKCAPGVEPPATSLSEIRLRKHDDMFRIEILPRSSDSDCNEKYFVLKLLDTEVSHVRPHPTCSGTLSLGL
ncbi:unnamed protein product [Amoebophrya sp. A25]|nr:unnamed protein product [Amoebophrya sp. A25]|eukprot:GSA25T00020658001.1